MFNRRINIFTGHFGSGKTEVAVNFALQLAKDNENTAIVDMDIVNPFFRTADVKAQLARNHIHVILPMYANTNVDVPALPGEINMLFERKDYKVVFDVGGDDLGARVLSRYKDSILSDDYEMFFVINTRRPMTDTVEKIVEMMDEIEASSRIKVTKLVNNTNLLSGTTIPDILEGQKLIERVSTLKNIPIAFTSSFMQPSNRQTDMLKCPLLTMNKYIHLPWEE